MPTLEEILLKHRPKGRPWTAMEVLVFLTTESELRKPSEYRKIFSHDLRWVKRRLAELDAIERPKQEEHTESISEAPEEPIVFAGLGLGEHPKSIPEAPEPVQMGLNVEISKDLLDPNKPTVEPEFARNLRAQLLCRRLGRQQGSKWEKWAWMEKNQDHLEVWCAANGRAPEEAVFSWYNNYLKGEREFRENAYRKTEEGMEALERAQVERREAEEAFLERERDTRGRDLWLDIDARTKGEE